MSERGRGGEGGGGCNKKRLPDDQPSRVQLLSREKMLRGTKAMKHGYHKFKTQEMPPHILAVNVLNVSQLPSNRRLARRTVNNLN
jgi:hypothetical protein